MDPFTFIEKDGFFYGRGTSDDKAMASHFVANLLRLKDEGFMPDRDVILALTADEEGGDFQRRRVAGQEPQGSDRRRVRDQRGRRRRHAKGQVPDERGAGQREGVPGFPSGGDQSGGTQLAADQGQRDLPPRPPASRGCRRTNFPSS